MQNVSRKRIRPSPEAGNHVRLRPRMRTRNLPAPGRPPDAGSAGAQPPLPCPSPETERGTPFGVPPSFRSVRDADYQLDLRTPGSSPRRAMLAFGTSSVSVTLAHEGPGTPADGATIVGAGAELGLTGSLHFKSGTGHSSTPTCGTACPAGPEGTCLPCPWSPR